MEKEIIKKVLRSLLYVILIVIYSRNVNSFEDFIEIKNLIGLTLFLIVLIFFIKADIKFYKKLLSDK